MSTVGVNETKDVVIFLAKVGVSIAQSVVNKHFEFGSFIEDLKSLPAAIAGVTSIPAEFKDIDGDEAKQLIESVLAELAPMGITNSESAKKFISAGFNFVEGVIDVIGGIQNLKK